MPKSCPRRLMLLTQLVVVSVEEGGLLLLFHLVSCYLLGFCQGSGSRQVYIPPPPLPIRAL